MHTFSVKKEFRAFCAESSVIPPSVESSNLVVRIIWSVAVIVFMSLTAVAVVRVFAAYFQYPTVDTLREVSQKSSMPWVTVCNQSPLSDNVDANMSWKDYIYYVEIAKMLWKAAPQDLLSRLGLSAEKAVTLLTWSETQFGYIASLPLPLKPMKNYNYNESNTHFIVDCHYLDWQLIAIPDSEINCRDTVQLVYNWQFYLCYSFRPPANVTRKIRGLTAIFYLDDFLVPNNNYFNSDVKLSQSSGVRLSVHTPGTESFVEKAEVIGPGTETLVQISQTNHTRLPEPYGTCTDRIHLESPNIQEGDDVYTIDTCYGLCMQQLMVDQCRCLDTEFPFNDSHLKQTTYKNFCINQTGSWSMRKIILQFVKFVDISDEKNVRYFEKAAFLANPDIFSGAEIVLKLVLCLLDLRMTLPKHTGTCRCPKPCKEYTYDASVSDAPWPHRSYQLAFYNKYIAPHSEIYGNKFDIYADIQADIGNLSEEQVLKRIDATKLIRRNFMRVDVLFDSNLSFELEQTPAITVDMMPSNVGGALTLYLDISLIFIVEIVDLLYNIYCQLLMSYCRRKKTSQSKRVHISISE